jgi:hypothetical protein
MEGSQSQVLLQMQDLVDDSEREGKEKEGEGHREAGPEEGVEEMQEPPPSLLSASSARVPRVVSPALSAPRSTNATPTLEGRSGMEASHLQEAPAEARLV